MFAKAAEVFPRARESLTRAIEAGVKVALGTDAPAIWHGRNAEELVVLTKRGMTPLQAIRAATTVAADLIDAPDLGRLAPGMLADVAVFSRDLLTASPDDILRDTRCDLTILGGRVVFDRAA